MTKLNEKAWALRTKIFELTNEIKSLAVECQSGEAKIQLDQVGCALAGIYLDLPDVFTDAARDRKDQEFADESDAIADAISEFDSIVFPHCGSGMPSGYDSWKLDNGRA